MNEISGPYPDAGTRADQAERFRQMLEAVPAAVYATDEAGRVIFWNSAAAKYAMCEPVLGSDQWSAMWQLYKTDLTPLGEAEYPLAIALRENRAIDGVEAVAGHPDGRFTRVLACASPLRDAGGKLTGALELLFDIAARWQAEESARVLMNEVTHRMGNNTQMLQSLLGTAMREASTTEAREILADVSRRVAAISAAQHTLYSENAASFEARAFLEALVRNASQGFGRKSDIRMEAASGMLSNAAAVPLALIVNELITNAVKHARGQRGHVSIRIGLVQDGSEWVLEIADDGPGFTMAEPQRRASGLGLGIALARQLGGTLSVTTDRGARCIVRFGGPRSGR